MSHAKLKTQISPHSMLVCICPLIRRAKENTASHDSHLSISLAHGSENVQKEPLCKEHTRFCVDVCMCMHKSKVQLA